MPKLSNQFAVLIVALINFSKADYYNTHNGGYNDQYSVVAIPYSGTYDSSNSFMEPSSAYQSQQVYEPQQMYDPQQQGIVLGYEPSYETQQIYHQPQQQVYQPMVGPLAGSYSGMNSEPSWHLLNYAQNAKRPSSFSANLLDPVNNADTVGPTYAVEPIRQAVEPMRQSASYAVEQHVPQSSQTLVLQSIPVKQSGGMKMASSSHHHHQQHNHQQACCGKMAYIPTQQYCTQDEKVVDLLPASPPSSPAPPPIYVQKVTLVCEGIRWEVPYPNYQCCGPSVYNVAKETCSADGLIEGRTAPPPSTSTTTEVPTRLLVCQGHRFLIPAYDFQFYACCSNDPYFWPRESCLNGAVSPARPSTTTTSATPQEVQVLLVCDGVQHWIPATERMFFGCCGHDLYDLRTDVCRPPISPSNTNHTRGSTTSCPNGYICCEDYPPVLNSNGSLQCCPGIGPFDPKTSVCPMQGRRRRRK